MSDLMLHGGLEAPVMAGDIIAVLQLKSVAKRASRRIYADKTQLEWCHAEIEMLKRDLYLANEMHLVNMEQEKEIERLSMQSNKFELIAEDHEAAMNCLDDMGAPRHENDIELSHHGRVLRLLEPKDAENKRLRALFREAADYLDKGYGTSIGGGSIFHQQFREASDE